WSKLGGLARAPGPFPELLASPWAKSAHPLPASSGPASGEEPRGGAEARGGAQPASVAARAAAARGLTDGARAGSRSGQARESGPRHEAPAPQEPLRSPGPRRTALAPSQGKGRRRGHGQPRGPADGAAAVPTLERLRAAQKRRAQQLKKWAQYEQDLQHRKRKHERKRSGGGRRKKVSFEASVALLEASLRNDADEGRPLCCLAAGGCLRLGASCSGFGLQGLGSGGGSHLLAVQLRFVPAFCVPLSSLWPLLVYQCFVAFPGGGLAMFPGSLWPLLLHILQMLRLKESVKELRGRGTYRSSRTLREAPFRFSSGYGALWERSRVTFLHHSAESSTADTWGEQPP
ncbi:hypothetical protein MC885_016948, partial [Smutsia gigantea]